MKAFIISSVLFISISINTGYAQIIRGEEFLRDSIFINASPLFKNILAKADTYKIQFIYTQINRDKNNQITYHTYSYHVDSSHYFYPASLVKMPLSAIALEKTADLKVYGVDKFTQIAFDSAFSCQSTLKTYKNPKQGYPSIGDFVKRMMLISDNESYSRAFEYCGQGYLHKRLSEMGYTGLRITHRFNPLCDSIENRYTNPLRFLGKKGELLYKQEMQISKEKLQNPLGKTIVGRSNIIEGKLIRQGRNFTFSNYLPLEKAHQMIQAILFPSSMPKRSRFNLAEEDYAIIRKYMRLYPRQSEYEEYTLKKGYFDAWKKYLYYGRDTENIENKNLRIYNVVGMSYGFLADCAYIADIEKNVDFFLSAVIYTNQSEIINSGNYEYQSIGLPFLKELGRLIYAYEIERKKEYNPELRKLLSENY